MRKLEKEMCCASQTDASVMFIGESGVGKRFAANMVHQLSPRRRAPFVAVNGADAHGDASDTAVDPINEGLLQAGDGTLFIQDVENISAPAQVQLGRFIEWTSTARRGARFMTAAGSHLFKRVKTGSFRDDLYYRLNVFCFVIPPLRDRPEDIPLMFRHYLSLHTTADAPRLSSAARQRLVEYSWPGNVRELRTLTRQLSAQRLPDVIEPQHLPCPIGE